MADGEISGMCKTVVENLFRQPQQYLTPLPNLNPMANLFMLGEQADGEGMAS
jgi:hypothetical protein